MTIILLVILIALVFEYINGFHDTANAMATPIATGALRPKTAVAIAAVTRSKAPAPRSVRAQRTRRSTRMVRSQRVTASR